MGKGIPVNSSGIDTAKLEELIVQQYRPEKPDRPTKPASASVVRVRRGREKKFLQTDLHRGEIGEHSVSHMNLGYKKDEIVVNSYFTVDVDVELRVKNRSSTGVRQYEVRMFFFRTTRRRLAVSMIFMRPKQPFEISGPWPFGSINYRIGYMNNDPTKPSIPSPHREAKKAS